VTAVAAGQSSPPQILRVPRFGLETGGLNWSKIFEKCGNLPRFVVEWSTTVVLMMVMPLKLEPVRRKTKNALMSILK
jgi:hypothetical protein